MSSRKNITVLSQYKPAASNSSLQLSRFREKSPWPKSNDDSIEKLAEEEMDIMHAQYLQMAFLESEAKKTLKLRSDYAMNTLCKLCSLIMHYITEVQSQTFKFQMKSTLVNMHKHSRKQEDILQPITEILPTLTKKYTSLAKTVNIMKHKLTVKDVLLPEPGHEGDILDVLEEIQKLITEFFEKKPQCKVISTVDALKNFADAGTLIMDALTRAFDLLEEVRDLNFSESSLGLS